jgi:hypothetical protein
MALAKTVFVKLERHLMGCKTCFVHTTHKKHVDAVVTVKITTYSSMSLSSLDFRKFKRHANINNYTFGQMPLTCYCSEYLNSNAPITACQQDCKHIRNSIIAWHPAHCFIEYTPCASILTDTLAWSTLCSGSQPTSPSIWWVLTLFKNWIHHCLEKRILSAV